jgi:predicted flap endonuclease-1-like 5' DNA nuclease
MTKASKKSAKKSNPINEDQSILKNLKGKYKTSKKELLAQVEELSNEISSFKKNNSTKKIFNKLEKKYQKKISDIQQELNNQIESHQTLKSKLIEHLPQNILEKLNLNNTANTTKAVKAIKKKPAIKSSAPAKKPLASIKGIGPVTLKKLEDAGFNSLEDLANTPKSKIEALKAFEKTNGFETWSKQAQDILSTK